MNASQRPTYRDLGEDELQLLATIDRAEQIDSHYVVQDGSLRLVDGRVDVVGWYPTEVDDYVARLHELRAAGGDVVGAWNGASLLALASLDARPVGSDPHLMKLDMLHVDAGHRRRGIGRELIELLAERARRRGATALYISATPTRNTVDAYVRLGAVLADPPDPDLIALEPEDVHLVLAL
jgi:GNAT superfamily N-acetyltransferase